MKTVNDITRPAGQMNAKASCFSSCLPYFLITVGAFAVWTGIMTVLIYRQFQK